MKKVLIVLLLFCTSFQTKSQSFNKLDSLSKVLIEKYNLPGIAIVGVQNDKVIYIKSFGKANENSSFNDSTLLYIASNTKAFTGLAVAKLVSEQKLKYSDPVTNYIDSSYFSKNIEANKITIEDLVHHTHGLSNDPLIFRTAYSGEYPTNLSELLKFTTYADDTLSHNFKYSNLGYVLCGIIIEQVSGMDWKQYVAKNILIPTGMLHTTPRMNFKPESAALPYDAYSNKPLSSTKSDNTLHAAGGLFSTLGDIGQWLMLFTNENQKVFSPDLLSSYLRFATVVDKRMGPFTMDKYANGWIEGTLTGNKLYYHFGSFSGYESLMSFNQTNHSGVFVFVNERLGGQRIATMLTSYYYMILDNHPSPDSAIKMFDAFINPLYADKKLVYPIFKFSNKTPLEGSYFNEAYGNLLVNKNDEGYIFSIGRLSALAYTDEESKNIIVEWTPGIKEEFTIENIDNVIQLKYGDFGVFRRL